MSDENNSTGFQANDGRYFSFSERCAVAQQCMPKSQFRERLTELHAEMMARIIETEHENVGYQAELAGYEASIAHLSRIVDNQRELLGKIEKTLGEDDFGVPLENGENPLLDEIRETLWYLPGKRVKE